ncbi:MAG: Rne/Rng family ribonuclease [Paludibacteraceae bacterium]|nr:Rne/Rng family ribonuclease [Paludibacteraceae bacterium]
MKNELVIDAQGSNVNIALLEDGRLAELNRENGKASFAVGDIYLAKVRKIMPELNAAFVDVGYERSAFLHYQDLGPQFRSMVAFTKGVISNGKKVAAVSKLQMQKEISKNGSITEVLDKGLEILVQIAKEPINTKGPRLTSEISIAGRYIVLMPFADKIYVSQKIKSGEERGRIKTMLRKCKPKNFGVIVRTVAEGRSQEELSFELNELVKKWNNAVASIDRNKEPQLLYQECSRTVSILRDIFNPSFDSIFVNEKETFHQICDYVRFIAPEKESIVKLYNNDQPIFDHFNITKQLKSSFGRTVSFKNGAYLIIEKTEAMHVVDVNSGNKSKAGYDQEMNAIEVNLAAADEIAHQLRLRDIGGIIVIDFIDMVKPENRQKLFERMRDNMAKDRARHNILQLSKFGLMQITRQRVRPAMTVETEEVCPTCHGKGVAQPSLLFTDELEGKMDFVRNTLKINNFKLYIHPFVESFVSKGWFFSSIKHRWKKMFGVKVLADQNLGFLQSRFVDSNGDIINLNDNPDTEELNKYQDD